MATLVISGILGFTLASYLTMVGTQNRSVVRSQTWNTSIPIAEAGVEEAIMHLNKNCLWSDITRAAVNWNADGWQTVSNGYQMTRYLGENHYVVTIATAAPNSEMSPAILSEGYVPAILAQNTPQTFFAAVGTANTTTTTDPQSVGRKVRVTTSRDGLMTGAMIAKNSIDFSGQNVETDSFDSENPSYSTLGQYDYLKRRANGDVAVNYGVYNTLSIGNANIFGSIAVGPGGSIAIGPGGQVGDFAWNATHNGIEPGHSRDDMNVSFPNVLVPFTGGWSAPTGRTVTNNVITSIRTTNTSSTYPSGSGIIYTNTVTTTTASYPTSGTYLGSVNTNTSYTTSSNYPSSGTYLGVIATNTTSLTGSNAPAGGTYIGTVITNSVAVTSVSYPSAPYGPVATNTTYTTTSTAPASGTYVGTVTINRRGNGSIRDYSYNQITGYNYRKITGYTWEKVTGYSFYQITGYTVARIVGYSLVTSTYTTNNTVAYYDYVFDSGLYKCSTIDGKILVLGDAIVYVTGDFSLTGNEGVQINPGARLRLYMGGSDAKISGNGVVNATGNADNFWYFGLPTNTSLEFSGNGTFTGVVYAPQANFDLGGGGTGDQDFIGASMTKTVRMHGHFHFHYDEALARKGASRGYVIESWDEVRLDANK